MLFAVVVSLALSLAAPQRADVNSECPGVERIPFASLTKARLRRAVKEETPLIVTGALETEGMWNVLGKNGGAGFVAAIVKQRMALRFPAYGVDFATRAGAAMTQGRALYHSSIYDALDPVTGKWSAPPSIAVVDSDLIAEDAVESPLGGDDLGGSGYPVIQGNRVVETTDEAVQAEWDASTRSGLTTTRVSTKLTTEQYPAGFGPDVSFEAKDSAGRVIETGAFGMNNINTDGSADFVFMTWNGAGSEQRLL